MALKGIGANAFMNQSTIVSVKFGGQCINVGENAFRGCVSLSEINGDNVIETIGSSAFAEAALSSATFNKLSYLYQYAFKNCSYLEYINIPNCNTIQTGTFQSCVSLSDVNIKNVLSIGEDAFAKCTALSNVDIPNCGDIGKNAFKECSNLTYVNNGFATVGVSAFYNCSKLKDIYLDRCVDIKNGAFENCTSLDRVNLAQCINIGKSAFKGCTNITQVSLSICEKIGVSAFANCSKLNRVYIYNQPNIFCKLGGSYVFCEHDGDNCSINNNITFFFRPDAIESYKEDEYWSHYIDNMIMMVDEKQIVYTTNNNSIIEVDETIADQIVKNEYYTNYGLMEFKDKITSLNQKIFKGSTTLTSIDIPSGCEIIGESEFEDCVNLNNITLSNTLNKIDDYAFKNCESFTSFTIPQSVTTLGEGIFAGCKNIEKFEGNFVTYDGKAVVYNDKLICVLPKDNSITEGRIHKISNISNTYITHLGKSCFNGCVNMRRIDIDNDIQTIGDNAFDGCTNLCEVHFTGGYPPTLVENVFKFENVRDDLKIFVPVNQLETYNNKWSYTNDADETIYMFNNIYPKAEDKTIIYYTNNPYNPTVNLSCPNGKYFTIPYTSDTLTKIFYSNDLITKVILGENIKKIGENAFLNCENLEYVYLSDSITQLQNSCFSGCVKLERIHIPSGFNNASNSVGSNVFYGCTKLKEFGTYYKNRVSNDNMCYIDNTNCLTFFAQGGLSGDTKEYSIPEYIIEIHKTAFRGSNIQKINLSTSTKVIGESAFENCSNLNSIDNWDFVETINQSAFKGCSSLGKISLSSRLKTISSYAFDGCEQMYTDNNIPDSVSVIGSYAFNNCISFKCIDNDKKEQIALNLGDIPYIREYTFNKCRSLTKVNINNKIGRIGPYAFAECLELKTVSIDRNPKLFEIQDFAFYNCEDLEELYLPETLTYIGKSAFESCKSYKGGTFLILPDDSKKYNLWIPDNITAMGESCFKKSGIEEMNISPSSMLSSIPNMAFESCDKLSSINILGATSIKTIGMGAFRNCENLCTGTGSGSVSVGRLELPSSISTIHDEAFNGCKNILYVQLPIYLRSLGNLCLATGNGNTDIYIPKSLTTPPSFYKQGLQTDGSTPFDVCNPPQTPEIIPRIYIHEDYASAYRNNIYWKQYTRRFTYFDEPDIEDYITVVVCDTNGFSNNINDWTNASVVFNKKIPAEWVNTDKTIYFNVYNSSGSQIYHPGGDRNYKWSFKITKDLATNEPPNTVVVISSGGSYASLGGTKTNPASYIKIVQAGNNVNFNGNQIKVNNY